MGASNENTPYEKLTTVLAEFGQASKPELGTHLVETFNLTEDEDFADQLTAVVDRPLTQEERFQIGVLEKAYRFFSDSFEEEE